MKFMLIVLAISGSFQLSAQDTTYFNQQWKPSTSADASYYRISVQNGEVFAVKDHYMDGSVQMTGAYKDPDHKVKHGYFTYYKISGSVSMEGRYNHDKKQDLWKWYFDSGALESISSYKDNVLDGDLKYYYPDGTLKREEVYKEGNFIKGTCYAANGRKVRFFPYEELAAYKGGKKAMNAFLSKHLKYPQEALDQNISGKVWLRIVVGTDGRIKDIKVTSGIHPSLDAAAVNAVRKMPRWIPGKVDGEAVSSYFDLPINFKLD